MQQIPENSDFWVCWFVSYVNSRVYIHTGDPFSIELFVSQRKPFPELYCWKSKHSREERVCINVRTCLNVFKKTHKAEGTSQGPCPLQTSPHYALSEWRPAADTAKLEPGPWGSKPSPLLLQSRSEGIQATLGSGKEAGRLV